MAGDPMPSWAKVAKSSYEITGYTAYAPPAPRLRYGVVIGDIEGTRLPATRHLHRRYMVVGGHDGDLDFAALELQPPHRIMSIPVETVTGRYPLYQVEEEA